MQSTQCKFQYDGSFFACENHVNERQLFLTLLGPIFTDSMEK